MKATLLAALLLAVVSTATLGEGPALVTIEPEGALADVKARDGIVLVDLYADW